MLLCHVLSIFRSLKSVAASILSSPGLFLVSSLILVVSVILMVSLLLLIFGLSILFSRFLVIVPSVPTSISIRVILMFYSFFQLWQGTSIFPLFSLLSISLNDLLVQHKPVDESLFSSCHLNLDLGIWAELCNPFVYQRPREFYEFHF